MHDASTETELCDNMETMKETRESNPAAGTLADIDMNKKEEAQSGDKPDFVKQMQATEPGPDEESPAGEDSKEVTSKETVAEERTEKLRVKNRLLSS